MEYKFSKSRKRWKGCKTWLSRDAKDN